MNIILIYVIEYFYIIAQKYYLKYGCFGCFSPRLLLAPDGNAIDCVVA